MLIQGFSQVNSHVYGDIMASQYRFRYRVFAQRQNYAVPVYNAMEYDAYDTPATVYFTWTDENGEVMGVSRVKPTDRPYMIKDIWPDLVDGELPESIRVWESSRFGVERSLDKNIKMMVAGALVCANQEFALLNGIDYYVGIMHPRIWKAVFEDSGAKVEYLGEVKRIEGGDKVVAAKMPVSFQILANVRETMGFDRPVLQMPGLKNKLDVKMVA
jgi:N-acyl-L-homoserine lactone synthetase